MRARNHTLQEFTRTRSSRRSLQEQEALDRELRMLVSAMMREDKSTYL